MKAKVLSREKWKDTKIDLVQNHEYKYKSTGVWVDWFIPCNADGYCKPLNFFMDKIFGSSKCRGSAKWFQLVGVIKGNQEIECEIDPVNKGTLNARVSGRLWVFANDVDCAYWNNCGSIEFEIEEVK